MSDNRTVSLHLALHPNSTLWVAMYKSSDPQAVGSKVREDEEVSSAFAVVDARRIISLDQIVAAANMALLRRREQQTDATAWDIVFAAAGSTHAGHVMRDYCFGESQEGTDATKSDAPMQQDGETTHVLAVGLDCTMEEFHAIASKVGLNDGPHALSYFSEEPREEQTANFIKWYKLTRQEVEMSSLEKAVLTRMATKYHV